MINANITASNMGLFKLHLECVWNSVWQERLKPGECVEHKVRDATIIVRRGDDIGETKQFYSSDNGKEAVNG